MIQDLLLFHSQKEGKLVSLKTYVEAMAEGQEKTYDFKMVDDELISEQEIEL